MPRNASELSQNLDKFRQIARRRRWWFLLPASVVATAAVVLSFLLPNRYKSEATILVEQQQVPERYVVPNSTTNLDGALQSMTQDVLSRSQLLRIIEDFNLYPKDKARLGPERLVDLMRNDIELDSIEDKNREREGKGLNAFKISYTGPSPETAQQVTARLTSLFIDEDLKTQEQRDMGTTNFLETQLTAAQADLDKKEQLLRDFKMQNLGELPEQQQGNLEILSGLETQLENTTAASGRANEQRVFLQSLLTQYETAAEDTGGSPGTPNTSPIETAQTELAHLQSERAALLGSYSPEYPDVIKIDGEIARTRTLLTELKSKPSKNDGQVTKGSPSAASSTFTATDNTIAQLKSQLKQNQLELADNAARQKKLEAAVGEYQHRLNLTPVREQQLTDLLRAYDLTKKNYDDLYTKKTESALATDLQKNQQGEQFRLIDPPNLPAKPVSPNRPKIAVFGLVGGVFAGVALAFFIEIKDGSFHSESDLRVQFPLPVVMGLPLSLNKHEKRIRLLKTSLEWMAGTVLVLLVIAAELYVNLKG